MKKLLFVYTKMIVGGSTTSLLSILNNLDYSKYSVDLLLYEIGGDLFEFIPKEVNILPQGNKYKRANKRLMLKRITSPSYLYAFFRSRTLSEKYKSSLIRQQIMSYESAKFSAKINKQYDVAIAFLEFWPAIYVAKYVNSHRKISWVHIDYKAIRLIPSFDVKCFAQFDNIVLVSGTCCKNFIDIYPQFRSKVLCIENILSKKSIRSMAKVFECKNDIGLEPGIINVVSVCRIVLSHKGLDRGVRAFSRIIEEGFKEGFKVDFKWYIIGEGPDFDILKEVIKKHSMDKYIVLLGKKINPFPYIACMDLFFLPSLYEGKPMAVTEALMLGVPALVSHYASAPDQITNGFDGIIVDNDEDAIFEGLKMLISNPETIHKLKANAESRDYSNISEMEKIYGIIGK